MSFKSSTKTKNIQTDNKSFWSVAGNESGWMLVVITLMIPLAIIALAFVIDLGKVYGTKEKIRYASDAALFAVGKVFPDRPELEDDGDKVEKLLEKMFLFNLRSNGLGWNDEDFSSPPKYNYITNPDGSHNISIKASYVTHPFYSTAIGILPGGGTFELQSVSSGSTYKIAKKKLMVGIILDLSQSVGTKRYLDLMLGLNDVIESLKDGNYIAINTFDKYWKEDVMDPKEDRYVMVPMAKFLTYGTVYPTVPEKNLSLLRGDLLEYSIKRVTPVPDGTYLQGAIFRMRNEMLQFTIKYKDMENWEEFTKVIFVLSDGDFTMRSDPYDNSTPYSPPASYVVPDEPLGIKCRAPKNTNPITVYEADQTRKAGIIVASICSNNCKNSDFNGRRSKATMKRLANIDLDSTDIENFPWQMDSSADCYIPYLTSGNERYKDPNPFILPVGLQESDLYSSSEDLDIGNKMNQILKKITFSGSQLEQ